MKILFTISLVTLIYALHVCSSVPSASHSVHEECCSVSVRVRVKAEQVKNVAYSNCSHKAIIVKTVHKAICLKADWKWAQDLLQNFNTANMKFPSPLSGSPNGTTNGTMNGTTNKTA